MQTDARERDAQLVDQALVIRPPSGAVKTSSMPQAWARDSPAHTMAICKEVRSSGGGAGRAAGGQPGAVAAEEVRSSGGGVEGGWGGVPPIEPRGALAGGGVTAGDGAQCGGCVGVLRRAKPGGGA